MARVYKFAQKEYGIESENITFFGHDDSTFTYNGVPVMGQGGTVTVASAIGSTPNASGLSVAKVGSVTTLTPQPADATHPGLVTNGTQTFAGPKTFSSGMTVQSGFSVANGQVTLPGVVATTIPNTETGRYGTMLLHDSGVIGKAACLNVNGDPPLAYYPSTGGLEVNSNVMDIYCNVAIHGYRLLADYATVNLGNILVPSTTTQSVTSSNRTMLIASTQNTSGVNQGFQKIPFGICDGIAPTSGQTCSLTPTQIGFGSMTPSNNQGLTLTSNRFRLLKPGTYRFMIKVQFSSGPTEWWIKMRQGAYGGTLTDTSADSGISAGTGGGTSTIIANFEFQAQPGTVDTEVDFTIAAQSFPAGSFPTINGSGSFSFIYIANFDYPEF